MSTLKVDALKSANGNSFILDVADRNMIINGDMQVAQKGTSANAVNGQTNTLDRWASIVQSGGFYQQDQSSDAPDGFQYSLKMTCTNNTTSYSATSGQIVVEQRVEGSELQHLKYGTTTPRSTTLSFWVKSSVTGTYSVQLLTSTGTQQLIAALYTINAADTWEKKTITFPGNDNTTFGAISSAYNSYLAVKFRLYAGTNYTSGTLATTWQNSLGADFAVGQTANVSSAVNNEWYITGVQWEVGENTTDFKYETFQQTFLKCSRYYQRLNRNISYPNYTEAVYIGWGQYFSTTQAVVPWPLITPFRGTAPTVQYNAATDITIVDNAPAAVGSTAIGLYNDTSQTGEYHIRRPVLLITVASATSGRIGRAFLSSGATSWVALNAEF